MKNMYLWMCNSGHIMTSKQTAECFPAEVSHRCCSTILTFVDAFKLCFLIHAPAGPGTNTKNNNKTNGLVSKLVKGFRFNYCNSDLHTYGS